MGFVPGSVSRRTCDGERGTMLGHIRVSLFLSSPRFYKSGRLCTICAWSSSWRFSHVCRVSQKVRPPPVVSYLFGHGPGGLMRLEILSSSACAVAEARYRSSRIRKPTCAIQGESIQGGSPEGGPALPQPSRGRPGADLFVVLGISTHCALLPFASQQGAGRKPTCAFLAISPM